jgi:hypothetical protein
MQGSISFLFETSILATAIPHSFRRKFAARDHAATCGAVLVYYTLLVLMWVKDELSICTQTNSAISATLSRMLS